MLDTNLFRHFFVTMRQKQAITEDELQRLLAVVKVGNHAEPMQYIMREIVKRIVAQGE